MVGNVCYGQFGLGQGDFHNAVIKTIFFGSVMGDAPFVAVGPVVAGILCDNLPVVAVQRIKTAGVDIHPGDDIIVDGCQLLDGIAHFYFNFRQSQSLA